MWVSNVYPGFPTEDSPRCHCNCNPVLVEVLGEQSEAGMMTLEMSQSLGITPTVAFPGDSMQWDMIVLKWLDTARGET